MSGDLRSSINFNLPWMFKRSWEWEASETEDSNEKGGKLVANKVDGKVFFKKLFFLHSVKVTRKILGSGGDIN